MSAGASLIAFADHRSSQWQARRNAAFSHPAIVVPNLAGVLFGNAISFRDAFKEILSSDWEVLHAVAASSSGAGRVPCSACRLPDSAPAPYAGDNVLADLWATPLASMAYVVTIDADEDLFLTVMALPDTKNLRRAWTIPLTEDLADHTIAAEALPPDMLGHDVANAGTCTGEVSR